MDNEAAARCHDGLKTALALARAQLSGDTEAMVALWTDTADLPALVQALAALPSLAVDTLAGALGVEVDMDAWYRESLLAMAARDN